MRAIHAELEELNDEAVGSGGDDQEELRGAGDMTMGRGRGDAVPGPHAPRCGQARLPRPDAGSSGVS